MLFDINKEVNSKLWLKRSNAVQSHSVFYSFSVGMGALQGCKTVLI